MEQELLKQIRTILLLLLVGVFACAFFLYDNYRDKMKLKEAVEASTAEQDAFMDSVIAAEAAAVEDAMFEDTLSNK